MLDLSLTPTRIPAREPTTVALTVTNADDREVSSVSVEIGLSSNLRLRSGSRFLRCDHLTAGQSHRWLLVVLPTDRAGERATVTLRLVTYQDATGRKHSEAAAPPIPVAIGEGPVVATGFEVRVVDARGLTRGEWSTVELAVTSDGPVRGLSVEVERGADSRARTGLSLGDGEELRVELPVRPTETGTAVPLALRLEGSTSDGGRVVRVAECSVPVRDPSAAAGAGPGADGAAGVAGGTTAANVSFTITNSTIGAVGPDASGTVRVGDEVTMSITSDSSELRSALRQLLDDPGVPWATGGLDEEREAIEAALDGDAEELEATRPVVARVLESSRSIGEGLASSALYALLVAFVGGIAERAGGLRPSSLAAGR